MLLPAFFQFGEFQTILSPSAWSCEFAHLAGYDGEVRILTLAEWLPSYLMTAEKAR